MLDPNIGKPNEDTEDEYYAQQEDEKLTKLAFEQQFRHQEVQHNIDRWYLDDSINPDNLKLTTIILFKRAIYQRKERCIYYPKDNVPDYPWAIKH